MSLPKAKPVVDGTESRRHLRETRRSLLVAACVAALVIMAGVQYLSTREPDAGLRTLPQKPPSSKAQVPAAPKRAPLVVFPPHAAPLSPQARAYLRKVRDLAENSLAQVEVMLAAVDRSERQTGEVADTLEYGIRRLQTWRRQFAALTPPQALQNQHHEVGRLLAELKRMAYAIRSSQTIAPSHPVRHRLTVVYDRLEQVLNTVDDI
ncbi:MAG TPA: hypothetical protein VE201_09045 [Nitrospirales bacterium]|nr:hypothetical protein [Nitrospirales bacterium]